MRHPVDRTHPARFVDLAGRAHSVALAVALAVVTEPLTRAARLAVKWTRERDRLIVAEHQAGRGVRDIARAAGLNHTSVLHILKRENKP